MKARRHSSTRTPQKPIQALRDAQVAFTKAQRTLHVRYEQTLAYSKKMIAQLNKTLLQTQKKLVTLRAQQKKLNASRKHTNPKTFALRFNTLKTTITATAATLAQLKNAKTDAQTELTALTTEFSKAFPAPATVRKSHKTVSTKQAPKRIPLSSTVTQTQKKQSKLENRPIMATDPQVEKIKQSLPQPILSGPITTT